MFISIFLFAFLSSDAVAASDGSDEGWEAPLITFNASLGTPAQQIKFAVAPDYEDVLVIGEFCVGIACKQLNGNRTFYKPSKSSTANDTGFEVKSRYGHSIVLGEYISEQITVDTLKAVPLEIGVLKRASPTFYHLKADGVFGLSLKNYYRSHGEFKSAFNSLLQNADTPQATVWINHATSNADRYGHIVFGSQSHKKIL
ncbi:hypothetical protein M3Y98_00238600 [Aphelenchoides besseyi]|nr:hypothetical protein M3Y98_00238600 [Aphelenchoides besseyi]